MLRRTIFAVAVFGSLAPASADVTDISVYPTQRGPNSCGTPMISADFEQGTRRAEPTAHAGEQKVIYLNKDGGTYTFAQGDSNSQTNQASRVAASGVAMAVVPKISSSFDWPMIAACVKEHFRPFNVRIVETEPVGVDHTEAVVGGDGSELGHHPGSGILGIAAVTSVCNVAQKGICFSFSEAHIGIPGRNQELCATIAHEIGHTLSLEHESLDTDLMSYVPVSQTDGKAFRNQNSTCGRYPEEQFPCSCVPGQTNSANRLNTNVGPRPTETNKPTLTIESPQNGSTLGPSFEIVAAATDAEGMADVRVLSGQYEVGNAQVASGGKYRVRVNVSNLGEQTLTVISRDLAGNETMANVTVDVELAATGDTCSTNGECRGGICATIGEDRFCTEDCSIDSSCPDGFTCTAAGSQQVCAPDESGCCSTSDHVPTGGLVLGLGVGLILVRRRRT